MIGSYYQDELQYLREIGPEFARSNPEIARWLADPGTDPDVERILEGVAFLCGRIRQKLDDELPEITESMMQVLWPHYLRPIPSMTILEFLPQLEAMQGPMEVAPGAEFASVPVNGTSCRYRSMEPVVLRPWSLADLHFETDPARPPRLTLRFRTSAKSSLGELKLGTLRLHLTGELRTAFTLYMLLAAHVGEVVVRKEPKGDDYRLSPECFVPHGFLRSETLIPFHPRSFAGYRLLQEYFSFKNRFLFMDLRGLDRAVGHLEAEDRIEIQVTFNRRLDSFPMVTRENIRLHCAGVVNLFHHAAEPLRLRRDRSEYLVQPSKSGLADRRHAEVFEVRSVWGTSGSEGFRQTEYLPLYSLSKRVRSEGGMPRFYQTCIRPDVCGRGTPFGTDTFITFPPHAQTGALPGDESISIDLLCTNRELPGELRAGDINVPTDTSPPATRFRNLLKPTQTISPPLGRGLQWRLISHMSLNHVSLADVDHLKQLLRVYDFQSEHDAQAALHRERMIEGIQSIRTRYAERVVRGATIRGTMIEMNLDEDSFAGEGDAFLFASIMDRFFGLYATLNGYTQLSMRLARSGQIYRFPPRSGEQRTPAEPRDDGHEESPGHASI